MDFSNANTTDEIIQMAIEIKKFVELQRPRSLLALIDFTGIKIDREKTMIIKGMAAHNRPYVRFIALVGLGCTRSIVFKLMLRLSGRKNHKVFGNREKALDWLLARQTVLIYKELQGNLF